MRQGITSFVVQLKLQRGAPNEPKSVEIDGLARICPNVQHFISLDARQTQVWEVSLFAGAQNDPVFAHDTEGHESEDLVAPAVSA